VNRVRPLRSHDPAGGELHDRLQDGVAARARDHLAQRAAEGVALRNGLRVRERPVLHLAQQGGEQLQGCDIALAHPG